MEDPNEIDPYELEASKYNLNYIKLDGNVGCMVNGAGLAMATMDIIKSFGGEPANFLDVGVSSRVDTVKNGFKIILQYKNVKSILINLKEYFHHPIQIISVVPEAQIILILWNLYLNHINNINISLKYQQKYQPKYKPKHQQKHQPKH